MATELDIKTKQLQVMGMSFFGLILGVWEMVGDSATSVSPAVGGSIIGMLENKFGLKIAGETPEDMIKDLCRIFVDEFVAGTEAKVEKFDNSIRVTIKNAAANQMNAQLKASGVEKNFYEPMLCVGLAALARMKIKSRGNAEFDMAANTQTITFELL